MRFVFVNHHYSADINSPEQWIDRLKFYVGSLEELSRSHTVIRVDQVNYTGHFLHNGVEYYCINPGKGKNYLPFKLHRFVRSLKPDVIVISSFLFPLQVIQLRKWVGKKIKIIVQNHADRPFAGIKKYLQLLASLNVDAFVFASKAMGDDWKAKGNINKSKPICEIVGGSSLFYPIEKSIAKERTKVNGDPVFIWVGRLNNNKDPLLVVHTFLELVTVQPAAKLYMIFQETDLLTDVEHIMATHASGASIMLVGKVSNKELLYWYNSADFYISASHYEGSGTALGEAMSCGCIPVVTDIFSFRFITGDGNCGVLYNPGSSSSLLAAMQTALKLNREEERQKSIAHFQQELSFASIANKLGSLATSL